MKRIFIPLILLIMISCTQAGKENKKGGIYMRNPEKRDILLNTKWENEIHSCIDYIEFVEKDSVILYDCPLDEKHFGTYNMKSDTIVIAITKGQYDNEIKEDSKSSQENYNFSLLLKSDTLFYVNDSKKIAYIKTKK